MPARLSDILNQARRQSFVGRDREIHLFEDLAFSPTLQFYLLYFFGPGGQGKTTLIKKFIDSCVGKQVDYIHLDGREIEAHPSSLVENLRSQLQLVEGVDPFEALAAKHERTILFIDTFEKLRPIDDWVRTDFLPQLPAQVFTVICGRYGPSMNWLADGGWQAIMKSVQLRNLSREESTEYLQRRQSPAEHIQTILDFTHGHPLALSVVADTFDQQPDKHFNPNESPDIVRSLLGLFLQQVPGPAHKSALEIASLVHITTESVLKEVMGMEDAGELFDWLRQLSFIEQGRDGLYPHDLVRETLVSDLRWRHPDWYAELHEKVRFYYTNKLVNSTGETQRRNLFELVYLHRTNPMVRPFFDWQETGSFWVDLMQPYDVPTLEAIIKQNEGDQGLAVFRYWAATPAAQVWVWRDGMKEPTAFVLKLNLHEWTYDGACPDKDLLAMYDHQYRGLQLRSGDQWAVFRQWMTNDTYQGLSNLQSSIFLTIVQYYFTPGLAVSMLCCADPEFWRPPFQYADLHHLTELDFSMTGRTYGWYAHDWRKRPIVAWLELLGKREIDANATLDISLEAPQLQVMVLSEDEFAQSVADALRSYHSRDELANNPLIQSRLVVRESGTEAGVAERIALLKQYIDNTLAMLENSPVDGKYYRVLYRTFINPVGSQEKTADFLNMSFSTYRRYLKAGVERVTELLWQDEVAG